jgi:hypothetical protein
MIPAEARRQLMTDHRPAVDEALLEAGRQGVKDFSLLLLDLRDERAQKMAADVADLEVLRGIVAAAETSQSAPVLVAIQPAAQAAALMSDHSRKAKQKFATRLAANRYRLIVIGDGGITWAVGAIAPHGPTGRVVG